MPRRGDHYFPPALKKVGIDDKAKLAAAFVETCKLTPQTAQNYANGFLRNGRENRAKVEEVIRAKGGEAELKEGWAERPPAAAPPPKPSPSPAPRRPRQAGSLFGPPPLPPPPEVPRINISISPDHKAQLGMLKALGVKNGSDLEALLAASGFHRVVAKDYARQFLGTHVPIHVIGKIGEAIRYAQENHWTVETAQAEQPPPPEPPPPDPGDTTVELSPKPIDNFPLVKNNPVLRDHLHGAHIHDDKAFVKALVDAGMEAENAVKMARPFLNGYIYPSPGAAAGSDYSATAVIVARKICNQAPETLYPAPRRSAAMDSRLANRRAGRAAGLRR